VKTKERNHPLALKTHLFRFCFIQSCWRKTWDTWGSFKGRSWVGGTEWVLSRGTAGVWLNSRTWNRMSVAMPALPCDGYAETKSNTPGLWMVTLNKSQCEHGRRLGVARRPVYKHLSPKSIVTLYFLSYLWHNKIWKRSIHQNRLQMQYSNMYQTDKQTRICTHFTSQGICWCHESQCLLMFT